jgi:stage II sporulation protein E
MSDGMGSGVEAHQESKTTVDLVSLFFRTGFNRDTVFETINDILLLRGEDEIFSTLDVCILDLAAGIIELTKIGSSPSYIIKDGQLEKITSTNLPIGILESVTPAAFRRTMHIEDCLIMMTDGVYDALNDKMTARELGQYMDYLQHSGKDANAMAKHILKTAVGDDQPFDDMSVLCMYLKESTPLAPNINIRNRMTNVLHIDRAKRRPVQSDDMGVSE